MTDRTEENKEFITNELEETKEIQLKHFEPAPSLESVPTPESGESGAELSQSEVADETPQEGTAPDNTESHQPQVPEKSKLDEETVEQLVENRFVPNPTKLNTNTPNGAKKKTHKRKKRKKSNFALTSLITFLSFILVFAVFFVGSYFIFSSTTKQAAKTSESSQNTNTKATVITEDEKIYAAEAEEDASTYTDKDTSISQSEHYYNDLVNNPESNDSEDNEKDEPAEKKDDSDEKTDDNEDELTLGEKDDGDEDSDKKSDSDKDDNKDDNKKDHSDDSSSSKKDNNEKTPEVLEKDEENQGIDFGI